MNTTSTDPISDMFSRIRNAALVNKSQVSLPHSSVKQNVAQILVNAGFLSGLKVEENAGRKILVIEIAAEDQPANISSIKRLSRPGKRVYVQAKEMPKVKHGRGMVVISTSQGMMTGAQAISQKLGGELICEVY